MELSGVSIIRAPTHSQGVLDHLQGPTSKTIRLGIRFPIYELEWVGGGGETSL